MNESQNITQRKKKVRQKEENVYCLNPFTWNSRTGKIYLW